MNVPEMLIRDFCAILGALSDLVELIGVDGITQEDAVGEIWRTKERFEALLCKDEEAP